MNKSGCALAFAVIQSLSVARTITKNRGPSIFLCVTPKSSRWNCPWPNIPRLRRNRKHWHRKPVHHAPADLSEPLELSSQFRFVVAAQFRRWVIFHSLANPVIHNVWARWKKGVVAFCLCFSSRLRDPKGATCQNGT